VKSLCRILSLTVMFAAAGQALAASEISGVWRGTLQIDPKTAITIDFAFARKPDGQYTAVLNSPTSGAIKNVAAKSVSLQNDALKVDVPALSGTFSGTVKDGAIDGKWAQPGTSLPLALTPKPQMPKADADIIVGTWNGTLTLPAQQVTFVMRFHVSDQSDLQGSLTVASSQGGGEFAMEEAEFAKGQVSFKVPTLRGEFTAHYVDGALNGRWRQGGAGLGIPVTMKKGDSAGVFRALKIPASSFPALSGQWVGTLKMKDAQGNEVSKSVTMGFGVNANADIVGYFGGDTVGPQGVPISEASLEGKKFIAKSEVSGVEYHGELAGATMKGEWVQGAQRGAVTLTRER
jgi:hypothetical protein